MNPRNQPRICAWPASVIVAAAISLTAGALHAGPIDILPKVSANAEFSQAVDLLARGRIEEADALFQQLTENNPEQLDAALGRAHIAITRQRLDEADGMVSEVLKRKADLPEAHNMKGLVLLLEKHTEEARREFSRAIELRPRYITPRIYLAVLARVSGDYTRAAAEYKALTGVAPKLPAGYLGQAEAQMLLRHEADALTTLEAWKKADPRSLLPYQVLANVYLADRQPQKAIGQLQDALAKDPRDSRTLTVLGNAYAATGNTSSAISEYEKALEANGANTDAALRLGELEAGKGRTEQALAYFRNVLKADPNNADPNSIAACNNIAWLLAGQGKDLDEALRLAELATRRDPKYVDGQDTLGWVRYRRGEYAQAVSVLQKASALAPSRTDITEHLRLAYARPGQKPNSPLDQMKSFWLWLVVAMVVVSSAVAVRYISKERRTANAAQGIA